MINPTAKAPTVSGGTQGEASYYRSNVTVRMNGASDVTSPIQKITYTITGTAKGNGTVAGQSVTTNQAVNIGETEIANNGTFTIEADGTWTVTAYAYDKSGRKTTSSNLVFTRDTVGPTITSFTSTNTGITKVDTTVNASDAFSGLATSGTYQYYQASTSKSITTSKIYQYTGLSGGTSYTLKVVVKDKAGNTSEKRLSITTKATVTNFAYTGAAQTFTVPQTGTYKLEVWGAQGAVNSANSQLGVGGKGGYSVGTISLSSGTTIYAYVGGQGKYSDSGKASGGWNGGGTSWATGTSEPAGGGGGGTDFRIGSTSLYARVIVAGGGGGGGEDGEAGGAGGGTSGIAGANGPTTVGTQTGPSGYFGQGGHTPNDGGGGRRWLVWRSTYWRFNDSTYK